MGGILLDVSEAGIGVQTVARIEPKQVVHFDVTLTGREARVHGTSEVAWANSSGQAGLKFLDVSEEARHKLKDWLLLNALTSWNPPPDLLTLEERTLKTGPAAAAPPPSRARMVRDGPRNKYRPMEEAARCRECGQINPPQNRYCGMCGRRLGSAAAAATTDHTGREEPRRRALAEEAISGPSYLGLNAPVQGRASYLLGSEPPRPWRAYMLLLILVVVGGLIWMQWRNTLKAPIARISALATQSSQPAPSQTPPEPEVSLTDQSQAAELRQKSEPETKAGTESAASGKRTAQAAAVPKSDVGSDQQETAAKEIDARSTEAENSRTRARLSSTLEDDSMLLLAQKYLQGRGVRQNCEQGLIYLRAVQPMSAKVRSQLGALYATGHCVPEDRVEAYRWFTSALALDPNNVWLKRQRDTLLARMTREGQEAR